MNFKTIVIMACIVGSVYMLNPVPTTDQNAYNANLVSLNDAAKTVNIVNGQLIIVGLGPFPTIIRVLADTIGKFGANLGDTGIAALDLGQICVPMNTLIGKAGLFTTVPFICQPLASVLTQFSQITTQMVNAKEPTTTQLTQLATATECISNAITAYTYNG